MRADIRGTRPRATDLGLYVGLRARELHYLHWLLSDAANRVIYGTGTDNSIRGLSALES